MKYLYYILAVVLLFATCQRTYAQNILVVEKTGTFKNYKYFTGGDITLRTISTGEKIGGAIFGITDSSIIVHYDKEVMLDDIERILRPRWGMNVLSVVTRIGGGGYFLLDAVNNVISGEPTIVHKNTAIISASLIAFSYAIVPFHNRRIRIGEKWRIKSLNMSLDGEEFIPPPQ